MIRPPRFRAINNLPVSDQTFIEQLHEVSHKINVVKEQSYKGAMACNDVKDVLDKLRVKAVAKIREFILQKIYSCRKPMSNYQVAQNSLLKYRYWIILNLGCAQRSPFHNSHPCACVCLSIQLWSILEIDHFIYLFFKKVGTPYMYKSESEEKPRILRILFNSIRRESSIMCHWFSQNSFLMLIFLKRNLEF